MPSKSELAARLESYLDQYQLGAHDDLLCLQMGVVLASLLAEYPHGSDLRSKIEDIARNITGMCSSNTHNEPLQAGRQKSTALSLTYTLRAELILLDQ